MKKMLTNENLKKYINAEEIFCCENGWTSSKKNSIPSGIPKTIRNTILCTQYERVLLDVPYIMSNWQKVGCNIGTL